MQGRGSGGLAPDVDFTHSRYGSSSRNAPSKLHPSPHRVTRSVPTASPSLVPVPPQQAHRPSQSADVVKSQSSSGVMKLFGSRPASPKAPKKARKPSKPDLMAAAAQASIEEQLKQYRLRQREVEHEAARQQHYKSSSRAHATMQAAPAQLKPSPALTAGSWQTVPNSPVLSSAQSSPLARPSPRMPSHSDSSPAVPVATIIPNHPPSFPNVIPGPPPQVSGSAVTQDSPPSRGGRQRVQPAYDYRHTFSPSQPLPLARPVLVPLSRHLREQGTAPAGTEKHTPQRSEPLLQREPQQHRPTQSLSERGERQYYSTTAPLNVSTSSSRSGGGSARQGSPQLMQTYAGPSRVQEQPSWGTARSPRQPTEPTRSRPVDEQDRTELRSQQRPQAASELPYDRSRDARGHADASPNLSAPTRPVRPEQRVSYSLPEGHREGEATAAQHGPGQDDRTLATRRRRLSSLTPGSVPRGLQLSADEPPVSILQPPSPVEPFDVSKSEFAALSSFKPPPASRLDGVHLGNIEGPNAVPAGYQVVPKGVSRIMASMRRTQGRRVQGPGQRWKRRSATGSVRRRSAMSAEGTAGDDTAI